VETVQRLCAARTQSLMTERTRDAPLECQPARKQHKETTVRRPLSSPQAQLIAPHRSHKYRRRPIRLIRCALPARPRPRGCPLLPLLPFLSPRPPQTQPKLNLNWPQTRAHRSCLFPRPLARQLSGRQATSGPSWASKWAVWAPLES